MPRLTAAWQLAEFAHSLRLENIPKDVRALAWTCLVDAVGCASFGSKFPWSHMIIDQALVGGSTGPCHLPTFSLSGLPAEQAALIAGVCAHAFELDSLRKPGAGVHPGATVALPALLVAQEVGADLDDLLCAITAGIEVMFRIGNATLHSAEQRGFHAPGITGPFGAAVATGLLRGLSVEQLVAAFGISGSMGGGLLAFSQGAGGMVKRLHMGRAAQAGVVAASLAARGFEGPETVLEGKFGLLDAYCLNSDPSRLTSQLSEVWEIRTLCLKRYACHVTAQAPIECLREIMVEHEFNGCEIQSVELAVSAKVLSHHSNPNPTDLAGAQYSVPYSFAVATLNDPENPQAFIDALESKQARDLASKIVLRQASPSQDKWGAELTIKLISGKIFHAQKETFRGTPETPFSPENLARKFETLTGVPLFMNDVDPVSAWLKPYHTR